METLDMSEILQDAYRLADLIVESEEVRSYLRLKKQMEEDPDAQRLIREFQKMKELYEEAQRFGIFHPNYHEAKEKADAFRRELRSHPVIGAYLEAEEELDRLLHEVSLILARSVSDAIKVPANDPEPGVRRARKSCGGC
jgi:cell fate (sporulation/competence/biofilm development) regulator YlbF (YheA/YmcA/DUF963 family)